MTTATLPTSERQLQAPAQVSPIVGTYKRAPMLFTRGAGIELFDADGRAYLDFTSGIGVNALGYGDQGLSAAMTSAISNGLIHVSNLFRSAPGEELAAMLVENSFADSVFFCNSGAEANEGAFKFVRKWARKNFAGEKCEIVALRGGFHGRLFASLAATDRPSYRAPFRPLAGAISISERNLETLKAKLDAETIAAVIVEPVQGEGGIRVLDPEFLQGLRVLTRERDIALIFDEIQCGLGRTGFLFAYEGVDVVPDIVTLAKPIAGGLPMGAILMTSAIASCVDAGDHGTTFGGGPFVTSVAKYVLGRLSDPKLLQNVRTNGAWFGDQLRQLAADNGRVRAVRGTGYIWGMDVVDSAADLVKRGQEAGFLMLTAGDHTLRFLPPLVATREDLQRGLQALRRVLA